MDTLIMIMSCIAMGYGFGCVQTAYIIGKTVGNIDIRDFGSGNAGTTNVTRILGPKVGAVVFVTDIAKAVACYILCSYIFSGSGTFINMGEPTFLPGMIGGIGVILGHNFPFFMKFKGGKGIASTLGVILCVDLRVALICFIAGFCVVYITRYISLASFIMTGLFPIAFLVLGYDFLYVGLAFFITALAYYKHRDNAKRLMSGTENKFSFAKKEDIAKIKKINSGGK